MFNNSIITPVPFRNIEKIGNFIMIARLRRIIYINVKKHGINKRDHSDSVIEAQVEEDEYEILGIHSSYKIVTMQDLGPRRTTAIVL